MDWQLNAAEARVLGCLLEKEIATPDYYPLSLHALVNGCNQKSNREPVVNYDEATVEEALAGLRAQGLSVRITGGDSRVPKHAQRFTEKFNLGRREAAVMCVLMLRGPQTTGELRGRSERLYPFDDLEAVEATLDRLAEMEFCRNCRARPASKNRAGATCFPAISPGKRRRPRPAPSRQRIARRWIAGRPIANGSPPWSAKSPACAASSRSSGVNSNKCLRASGSYDTTDSGLPAHRGCISGY